jgi:hypothetical protein
LALSGSQAEVKRQAIEIARLRKEDAASKNEAETTLFLNVKKRSATQDSLEKELQVANQQVQSLEANVFELANNFTQLDGALKTEQNV